MQTFRSVLELFCGHLFLCKRSSWFLFKSGTQFWLVVLTQFRGFMFGKIHNFTVKILKLYLKLAIEEGETFENKFFKMFSKLTTVKLLVYKVKANCVNLVFRLKLAKVIMKMIDLFFPVAGLHISKTLNAWILFCKTWMATENCYHKILLKAKLITSNSFVTFTEKIRTTSVNLYWTF